MSRSKRLKAIPGLAIGSLIVMGFISAPAADINAERSDPSHRVQSPATGAALISDCLETWAQNEQTFDEERFLAAFDTCLQNASHWFDMSSIAFETEREPLASNEGRGFECVDEKWGCTTTIVCPQLGIPPRTKCLISSCGTGKCPTCPNFTGNILIKTWCAYVCRTDGKPVGGGFEVISSWGQHFGPLCFGS